MGIVKERKFMKDGIYVNYNGMTAFNSIDKKVCESFFGVAITVDMLEILKDRYIAKTGEEPFIYETDIEMSVTYKDNGLASRGLPYAVSYRQ